MLFGVDPSTFATLLATPSASLLATLSFTANVLAALVAAIFFLYHGVVFAIRAAARGEADTQKDGVWVFSRGAMALMLCAPLAGGYSFLQVTLIWLAGMGSQVADTAWDAMKSEMSATPASIGSGVWLDRMVATNADKSITDKLAQSMVCMATAERLYGFEGSITPPPAIYPMETRQIDGWFGGDLGVVHGWSFGGGGEGTELPFGICGHLTLVMPRPGSDNDRIAHLGYQSLNASLPAAVAEYQNTVRSAALTATSDSRIAVGDTFAEAEKQFRRRLQAAVRAAQAASTPMQRALFDQTMGRVDGAGWIGAGVTYLAAAQYERSIATLALIPFSGLDAKGPSTTWRMPRELKNEFVIYNDKVMESIHLRRDSQYGTGDVSLMEVAGSCFNPMNDKPCFEGVARAVWQESRAFLTSLTEGGEEDGGDPLAAVQRFGQNMFGASTTLLAGGGSISMASQSLGRSAAGLHPAGAFVSVGGENLGAMMMAVGWALLGVGIMMGFYIPMLPMILWATGVVIWLVTTAQMVVTAPVWAVMHAAGEGEGLAGSRAQFGYQVAFSLFIRPILMLAGLFAGLLIARIGMGVAGYLFNIFGDTLMDGVSNPLAGVVIVVIMAVSLVALARFAFSLIYTMPDWAQRLVGAHEMGEGMQEQSLRGAVSGLSSEFRSFARDMKIIRGPKRDNNNNNNRGNRGNLGRGP
jgi:conjugal transfer/type IV secretion protein DotA/TraY